MKERLLDELRSECILMKKLDFKPNYAELARRYDCDYRTIKKYWNEDVIKNKKRDKASKLDAYKNDIIQKLSTDRTTVAGVYEQLVSKYGYDTIGTYSNFRIYCKKHKLKRKEKDNANPRYETEAGDMAQVDWKEDISITSSMGEVFTINIFHIVLKFSRYSYIELSVSKEQSAVFRIMVNAFRFFGGVPKRCLFDNMSTAANISVTPKKVNDRMAQFAKDMGFKPQLCKARHAYTKGTNEARNKMLDWIRSYDGEFKTIDDLLKIVEEINNKMNYKRCEGTEMPPVLLYTKEKEYLRPLPNKEVMDSYLLPAKVKVDSSQLISYEGCKYSVDNSLINEYVQPEIFNNKLYIYYKGKLVTVHETIGIKPINYKKEHYVQMMKHTIKEENIETAVQDNLSIMDKLIESRKVHITKEMALESYEQMMAYLIYQSQENKKLIYWLSSMIRDEKDCLNEQLKQLLPYVINEVEFMKALIEMTKHKEIKDLCFEMWKLEDSKRYSFLSDSGYIEIQSSHIQEITQYYGDIQNEYNNGIDKQIR